MIPLSDQISCVAREIALRKSAYPKWVANGRMKQEAADKEIARMEAVIETLNALRAKDGTTETLSRTALNPQAAWPFPKGS